MAFEYKGQWFDLPGDIIDHGMWVGRHCTLPHRQRWQSREGWPGNCLLHYAHFRIKLRDRALRREAKAEFEHIAAAIERSEE